jgi:hypothetical protein
MEFLLLLMQPLPAIITTAIAIKPELRNLRHLFRCRFRSLCLATELDNFTLEFLANLELEDLVNASRLLACKCNWLAPQISLFQVKLALIGFLELFS